MTDPWADLRGVPRPIEERCGALTQRGTPCRAERSQCGWHSRAAQGAAPVNAPADPAPPPHGPGDAPERAERGEAEPYRYRSARLRHLNPGEGWRRKRYAEREWDGPPDGPPDGDGEPIPRGA